VSQRILITGGASGFGHALAALYAARGDLVLVTDLHESADMVDLPTPVADGAVHYRRLDVRDEADWDKARAWVEETWGGLDLLFNNAGVASGGRFERIELDEWQRVVDTNLLGVVRGCRAFVPMLTSQRHGRVVNIASMAGLVHPPSMASYNVAKAGVVALSETLLHELAPYDVGVSVVCSSFFRSNLHRSLPSSDPETQATVRRLVGRSDQDAEVVAARAVKQLDRGRFLVLTHPGAAGVYRAKRWVPGLYRRGMRRLGVRAARRAAGRAAGRDGDR
jgi:NAD(P)-dependent dehydrogenase (short-subunit alcohol dehydrogenase family)